MGNNSAFTAFEGVTLAVYDAGVLNKKLLQKIASCFQDQDADTGGYSGTLAKDGKDLREIVAATCGAKLPTKPVLPKDYRKWTPEQDDANEAYQEALWNAFHKATGL